MGTGQTTPTVRWALIQADGSWNGVAYDDGTQPTADTDAGESLYEIPFDWFSGTASPEWSPDARAWIYAPDENSAGPTDHDILFALIPSLVTKGVITTTERDTILTGTPL